MDLGGWLRSFGLEKYEAAFREKEIDETALPNLTAEDLKELGVTALGQRELISNAADACERLSKNDQDVRKQDRRIEAKAANRLQRNLRRSFGIEAEIEKARRLLAQCPVFGKIPTGLPHQPERGNGLAFARQYAKQWFVHARRRHVLILNQNNLRESCCSTWTVDWTHTIECTCDPRFTHKGGWAFGTGFDQAALKSLYETMQSLRTNKKPFNQKVKSENATTWLIPKLVGEVKFSEWTSKSEMRHPNMI